MPTIELLNLENKPVGTVELADSVFNVTVNVPLVHQVIKAQRAGWRQGTAKTKIKSEVRGGGRKPFRQKGTGNARQGSIRSPLNPGGGQTFGPIPRSYLQSTPKEMVRGALRSALTDRVLAKRLLVINDMSLTSNKTKDFDLILKKRFQIDQILIIEEENDLLERSARNIPHVKVLKSSSLNVYDIIRNEWIMVSKRSLDAIQSRLGSEN
jgi:large subunit ribosomal protein L4